jgi:hypothetical protein
MRIKASVEYERQRHSIKDLGIEGFRDFSQQSTINNPKGIWIK